MVFTLGLRHTLVLWQRAISLVQFPAVQASLTSFENGDVKTFRYVPLDVWFVDVATNDTDDVHESIGASEEYHVAAQVGRPNSLAQFWALISNLWVL
ncbi:hypothetical protein GCM10023156_47800 [Novipirellula rosea]|uniref:Tyrosine-protein phosphatase domain-containing protein n=1 Tax=Novipirellula rosea TaxID=1031540 RepID=A0ABP8NBA3_9BACT